jgi:hypothetical protein
MKLIGKSIADIAKIYVLGKLCQSSNENQLSAIGRTCADERQQWLDRAVSFSTSDTTKSFGYRGTIGSYAGWFSESGTSR